MAKSAYKLDFAVRAAGLKINAAGFNALMEKTIAVLQKEAGLKAKMRGGTIHAVLAGDDEIAILNAAYRGKNKPTDVISLSYFEEDGFPGEGDLVGEIMISVETARRQAKSHKHSLEKELLYLFAHGMLHLFGYDHERAAERKAMFELQDKIVGAKSWRKIAG